VNNDSKKSVEALQPPALYLQSFFVPSDVEMEFEGHNLCPITHLLFRDPVLTCDGQTYEREAIEAWFAKGNISSPNTNLPLKNKKLIPNHAVKQEINSLMIKHPALIDSSCRYLPRSWMTELQTACRTENEKWLRKLVQRDRRLLVHPLKDAKGLKQTALHFAAAGNPVALDVIIKLLENRQPGLAQVGLQQLNHNGQLPFHVALLAKQAAQTLINLMTWMGKDIDSIEPLKDLNPGSQATLNITLAWFIWQKDEDKAQCLRRLGAKEIVVCHGESPYLKDPQFQNQLGRCYAEGRGVEKDEKAAFELFREAAKQGNLSAQYHLGKCYQDGEGVNKDAKAAVYWYRKAAAQGELNAQLFLGNCYQYGLGIEKDENAAVDWYRNAAEQGHINSQNHLGNCYAHGECVNKDAKIAFQWHLKAAKQGEPNAQARIGFCYLAGIGVEKDAKAGISWYCAAAEKENPAAQNGLGHCYEQGIWVEKDREKAIFWYQKAAAQDFDKAKKNIKRLSNPSLIQTLYTLFNRNRTQSRTDNMMVTESKYN
jgi:TPR repeat protein